MNHNIMTAEKNYLNVYGVIFSLNLDKSKGAYFLFFYQSCNLY